MKLLRLLPLALLLTGCAHNFQQTVDNNIQGLPSPTQVYVASFTVAEGSLTPSQAASQRLSGSYTAFIPKSVADKAAADIARSTQGALVSNLVPYGLPVTATPANFVPPVGSLLIEGQLNTVKDGNSFQPLSAGLSAGQSKVVAFVSVYYVSSGGLVSMTQFYADKKNARNPGAASTLAALPANGNNAVFDACAQNAQADALKIAKKVGGKIGTIFEEEGWVSYPSN